MNRKGDNTDSARAVNSDSPSAPDPPKKRRPRKPKRIWGLNPELAYTKREVNNWAENDRLAGLMSDNGFEWTGGEPWKDTSHQKRDSVFEWSMGRSILTFLSYHPELLDKAADLAKPEPPKPAKPKSPRKKKE